MSPPAVFSYTNVSSSCVFLTNMSPPSVFSYTNVSSSCVFLTNASSSCVFLYKPLVPPTCQYCVFVVLWMRCCWITTIMVRTKRPWLGARWRSYEYNTVYVQSWMTVCPFLFVTHFWRMITISTRRPAQWGISLLQVRLDVDWVQGPGAVSRPIELRLLGAPRLSHLEFQHCSVQHSKVH